MGWIRYPDKNSLQAVHKANGEEVARRYLRFDQYGGTERAHALAQRWLRLCKQLAPSQPRLATGPQANKSQDYPRGVWHSVDRRRGYIVHRMNALWHDGEKRRTKTFHIGRAEHITDADWRAAETAAITFREEFVRCATAGKVEVFDPGPWDNWRERHISVSSTIF